MYQPILTTLNLKHLLQIQVPRAASTRTVSSRDRSKIGTFYRKIETFNIFKRTVREQILSILLSGSFSLIIFYLP